jgi:hypothetical protein
MTRRLKVTMAITLAAFMMVFVACAVVTHYVEQFKLSMSNLCGERVGEAITSIDRRYVARVHEINCGATTPFNTTVELGQVDNSLAHDFVTVFRYRGLGESLSLEWVTPTTLIIDNHGPMPPVERRTVWHDVTLIYRGPESR